MLFFRRKVRPAPTAGEDKILQLIAEYPLYKPPHWANLAALTAQEFHENRNYILFRMGDRIGILKNFFGEFEINTDFSDEAIINISRWLANNILALPPAISMDREIGDIFYNYCEPWEKEYRVLNFQFDLGLFFGQAVISRKKKAEWSFLGGTNRVGFNFKSQNISIYRASSRPFDPFVKVAGITNNIRLHAHSIRMKKCQNPDFVRKHICHTFANTLRSYANPHFKGAEYE